MKISYTWLQEHFDEKLPLPEELAEVLTLKAYEVEGVDPIRADGPNKGSRDTTSNGVGEIVDWVLDIDILPNRASDSLSHRGIAREVGVLFDLPLNPPKVELKEAGNGEVSDFVALSVETPEVRRALKRVVTDVKIEESPEWLKSLLSAVGQRSINNIVDLTNFVMLETGQPVHAFDYDKVAGDAPKKVIIREARKGEKITALDEQEYELDEGMLAIADSEQALDIAGIKGGKESGVDEGTSRLLLSVCNFDPVTTRVTSQKLGLRTDASKRFENEVPLYLAEEAMYMLAASIEAHGWGKVVKGELEQYPAPQQTETVSVSRERINTILGTTLSSEEVEGIFKRLQFEYIKEGEGFTVTPPLWRLDITEPIDVVEEVGRVYGYGNISTPHLEARLPSGESAREFVVANVVRDILTEEGYSEVYTYSFQASGEVELRNKLAEDKGFLRADLSAGLRDALEENMKRKDLFGGDALKLFEIGHVFTAEREEVHLAVGIAGAAKKFDVEGELNRIKEAIEEKFSVRLTPKEDISLRGQVGHLEDGIWEVDITDLIEGESELPEEWFKNIESNIQFEEPLVYPYVLRDIALWSSSQIPNPQSHITDILKEEGGELLVNYWLFDEFSKDDRTSYAYRLVFQSKEKTLSDSEVNEIMERITTKLREEEFEVR